MILKLFTDNIGWLKSICSQEKMEGLVQERRNSIANALELRLSCTNPSKWYWKPKENFRLT